MRSSEEAPVNSRYRFTQNCSKIEASLLAINAPSKLGAIWIYPSSLNLAMSPN